MAKLSTGWNMSAMSNTVRGRSSTLEIPDTLYRELKTHAAVEGASVRSLILRAVEQSFAKPVTRNRIQFPLIRGKANGINPTQEQIEAAILG
jgi:hypothetical protein